MASQILDDPRRRLRWIGGTCAGVGGLLCAAWAVITALCLPGLVAGREPPDFGSVMGTVLAAPLFLFGGGLLWSGLLVMGGSRSSVVAGLALAGVAAGLCLWTAAAVPKPAIALTFVCCAVVFGLLIVQLFMAFGAIRSAGATGTAFTPILRQTPSAAPAEDDNAHPGPVPRC